jgi:ArsR family transcriptional regulator
VGSSVELLVSQLKAAGEETRVRLLALLAEGERTVKELTEILGQSQPRISRHLKVLAEAGLVARRLKGPGFTTGLRTRKPGGRGARHSQRA